MGMLADCAEACLELTRFVDKETFDIGLVPGRLEQFKDVCELVFARGGCMHNAATQQATSFVFHRRRPTEDNR